jgi:hypothetical protein
MVESTHSGDGNKMTRRDEAAKTRRDGARRGFARSFVRPFAASLALLLLPALFVAGAAEADELSSNPSRFDFVAGPLADLLFVPSDPAEWTSVSTDQALATAVEQGNDPDLERKSNFRKKKTDLFRTQRMVEIGQAQMLVRLRLRAKTRETMSIEVHF